jgi:aminoglycoside 6'-N-acetyltransferase
VTVNALTVRPLTRDDLPRVSQWLAEPHVAQWWRDESDLTSVEAMYLPCLDGTDPAEVFVIETEGRAAGLIERYLVADDPVWDHAMQATGAVTGCAAGIDYLIGEPGLTGRGYGTAAISLFTTLTFGRYPQADAIVAAPQQANVASWRALERAGYHRWWGAQLESSAPSDAGPAYLYGIRRTDGAGGAHETGVTDGTGPRRIPR